MSLPLATLPCRLPEPESEPEPQLFPCDVQSLGLEYEPPNIIGKRNKYRISELLSGKYVPIKAPRLEANKQLRFSPPPDDAPSRIQSDLCWFDLVMEIVAPTAKLEGDDIPGFEEQKQLAPSEPSSVCIDGIWKAQCPSDEDHRVVVFSPERDAKYLAEGKKAASMSVDLYSRDWKSRWFTICTGFFRRSVYRNLFKWRAYAARYDVMASSCGHPASGKAVTDLSALIIAYPEEAFGVKIELGGFSNKFVRGGILYKEKGFSDFIRHPFANWNHKEEEPESNKNKDDGKITITAIIDDEEIELYSNSKPPPQGSNPASSQNPSSGSTPPGIKSQIWDGLRKYVDAALFIQQFSPCFVQPRIGGELHFLDGEISFLGAYRQDQIADRFISVAYRAVFIAKGVLVSGAGSIAIAVGKVILGSGAQIIVAIRLEGTIEGEWELNFVSTNPHLETVTRTVEGEIALTASGTIEVTLLYLDMVTVGAEVTAHITVEPKTERDEMKWDVTYPDLEFVGFVHSCFLPSRKPYRKTLLRHKKIGSDAP